MNIKLIEKQVVCHKEEIHYKININNKEVYVTKWHEEDEFRFEGDTEIFKGIELLTEEEQEEVLNYIEEKLADKGI